MGMQRKKSLPGVQYAVGGISLFVFLSTEKQIAAVLLFRSISRQSKAAERCFTAIPRIAVSDLEGNFARQFHRSLSRIRITPG